MYNCESTCVCGSQLVLCEIEVVTRIQIAHREKYGLPFPTPNNEWVSRCRRCGRHYLILGHNSDEGEKTTLYPHFFYHSVISWNQLRRGEHRLPLVTLDELAIYYREYVPELSWEAAMVNAFEFDLGERSSRAKKRRSFVYGARHCDLERGAPFRKNNDLSFTIPYLE